MCIRDRATPIPRTLHMALTGVRDISIIDTAPAERLPVETYVGESDDARIRTAILRELDRGGQVFFVHNRVQSILIVRKRLEKLAPEARVVAVSYTHLRAHETVLDLVCRLLLEKKKQLTIVHI